VRPCPDEEPRVQLGAREVTPLRLFPEVG
jgi:hypothetical protein